MKRAFIALIMVATSACAQPRLKLDIEMGPPGPAPVKEQDCVDVNFYAKGLTMLHATGIPREDIPPSSKVLNFDTAAVQDAVWRNQSVEYITWNCEALGSQNLAVTLK